MAGSTYTQKIKIKLDGANKAAKGSKKVSKGMSDLAKKAVALSAAYFGSQALIAGIKKSTEAFAQQELAQRRLTLSTGKSATALSLHAQALQKNTVFGDEAIMAQQAFLGSIGMSEQQIKAILPVAADLASATGMTLESAVRNTAKTFSGLAGELGELVPQLRDLTAEEMKAGKAVEIMNELFAGQAQIATTTFSGAMKQADNRIGDVAESFGSALAPAVLAGKTAFVELLEATADWLGITPDVNDAMRESVAVLEAARQIMMVNFSLLRQENTPRNKKKELVEELNTKYAEYTGFLLTESSTIEDIATFQERANAKLITNIQIKMNKARVEYETSQIEDKALDAAEKRSKIDEYLIKLGADRSEVIRMTNEELINLLRNTVNSEYIYTKEQKALFNGNKLLLDQKKNIKVSLYYLDLKNRKVVEHINNLNEAITAETEYAKNLNEATKEEKAAAAEAERLAKIEQERLDAIQRAIDQEAAYKQSLTDAAELQKKQAKWKKEWLELNEQEGKKVEDTVETYDSWVKKIQEKVDADKEEAGWIATLITNNKDLALAMGYVKDEKEDDIVTYKEYEAAQLKKHTADVQELANIAAFIKDYPKKAKALGLIKEEKEKELEGYDAYEAAQLKKYQADIDELANIAAFIKDYPKKAKALGLVQDAELEGFDLFESNKLKEFDLNAQELQWVDDFVEKYPEKAKALGLVNKETSDAIALAEEKIKVDQMAMKVAGDSIKGLHDLGKAFGAHQKDLANLMAIKAIIEAFAAAQSQYNLVSGTLPPPAPQIAYAAALASGLAQAYSVRKQATSMKAAEGMDEIVTEPTLILAGEAGAEYVDIEPLTNEGAGRKGGINITFSGNILSQDWVENEAIPKIREAIRKGGDIGIG